MAVTDVSIFNMGLSKIGHEVRISEIGEASRAGEQAELIYAQIRDELLQSHPWNFSIGRKSLSRDATNPEFEYNYQYLLPADCLRAIKLYDSSEAFKIESNDDGETRLLTNASSVNLIYIRRITNPTLFSPLFVATLVLKLAMSLQEVITGSVKVDSAEFEKTFREAKRRDGQEGTPDMIISGGPADFKNGFYR